MSLLVLFKVGRVQVSVFTNYFETCDLFLVIYVFNK